MSDADIPKRGKFIVIEGPDFSGKTTQTDLLAEELTKMEIDFIRVREPGGTDMGEIVRNILKTDQSLVDNAELLLFAAARAQIVQQVIEPALAAGKWVIADRFLPSTIAMQYHARGFFETRGIETIVSLTKMMVQPHAHSEPVIPDLTVFLMPAVELLEARAAKRMGGLDRLEDNQVFVDRVREGYRLLCGGGLPGLQAYGTRCPPSDDLTSYAGIEYTRSKVVMRQTYELEAEVIAQQVRQCIAMNVYNEKHTFKSERVTQ